MQRYFFNESYLAVGVPPIDVMDLREAGILRSRTRTLDREDVVKEVGVMVNVSDFGDVA